MAVGIEELVVEPWAAASAAKRNVNNMMDVEEKCTIELLAQKCFITGNVSYL